MPHNGDNYPRVWFLQHKFNPEQQTAVADGGNFPLFLRPARKIGLSDVKQALRSHYENSEHDPYTNNNPREPWRSVSVFRTQESHILQVRPKLSAAIGEVEYVAFGMPDLSVYLPYYQGIDHSLPEYRQRTDRASDNSAYWKFRKLQTLVMQNYPARATDIQHNCLLFEQQTAWRQHVMEQAYLKIYQSHPGKARRLLQQFADQTMREALALADQLTNQLLTRMTSETDMMYHFRGS